jgi:hypothetical protein
VWRSKYPSGTVGDHLADRPAVAGARVRRRIEDGENSVADLELGEEIDRRNFDSGTAFLALFRIRGA